MFNKIEIQTDSLIAISYAENGNIPVCVAEIGKIEEPNKFYFHRLFVKKEYRNKGWATKLMEELTTKCDEREIEVLLEINPYTDEIDYQQLESFYKKFGFEKVGDHYIRKPRTN